MTARLYVDLKEDCNGDIVGRVSLSKDSVFVFEALAEVVEQFSESCGVSPQEILNDIGKSIRSSSESPR